MATKKVKFTFKVTGQIDDLEVYIQNKRIEHQNMKGSHEKEYSDSSPLKVNFYLSGENGTDYSIEYTCKSDGSKKEDEDKTSPVEGTIKSGGSKKELLTINL